MRGEDIYTKRVGKGGGPDRRPLGQVESGEGKRRSNRVSEFLLYDKEIGGAEAFPSNPSEGKRTCYQMRPYDPEKRRSPTGPDHDLSQGGTIKSRGRRTRGGGVEVLMGNF